MNDNPLLVFARRLDGHLQLLQRVLTHPVSPGLGHLQHTDQFALEGLTFAKETGVGVGVGARTRFGVLRLG